MAFGNPLIWILADFRNSFVAALAAFSVLLPVRIKIENCSGFQENLHEL